MSHGFFYVRGDEFLDDVPAEHRSAFFPASQSAASNLAALKIRVANECNTTRYSAHWGGVVDGRPLAAGLQVSAAAIGSARARV